MEVFKVVILFFSWFFIVAVILPFVRNDHWVFRAFEYPRFQKFTITLILAVTCCLFFDITQFSFPTVTTGLLSLATIYLGYKIFPYTPFQKKEMLRVDPKDNNKQLKIFTANVFQDNRDYQRMLQQIEGTDADMVFLLETDKAWMQATDALLKTHPHTLKAPLENTYGLLFYSRFPIREGAVKYLVENDIPSIEAIIELPSGDEVKVFGLHPKPPVPMEDPTSTAKDKELMKVALKVKDCKLPTIVMGDLNDVAWSYVTELFRKNSGLLDPRRGRGFYSTFSAFNWFMRFPLDYIFCSSHFGLISMRRMPKNGSDHFAMLSHLELQPALVHVQEEPEADVEEVKEAEEKARA